MASTTLNQFKQLFPASATSSKLSAGKVLITVKLKPYWGDNTVDELTTLVNSLDIPGSHLHLYNVQKGCIACNWLCPAVYFEELRETADSLEFEGVLRVFAGEGEIIWGCSQPYQGNDCLFSYASCVLALNLRHGSQVCVCCVCVCAYVCVCMHVCVCVCLCVCNSYLQPAPPPTHRSLTVSDGGEEGLGIYARFSCKHY